jgi:tRNA(Ile)-lysidine synthase
MQREFLAYVNEHNLFTRQHKLALAISGGLDSVVLLHLLLNSDFKPALAHVNFKLRGEESDGDEKFVKNLADKYNLDFYTTELAAEAEAEKKGISIQMAARNLRYTWFKTLEQTEGFDRILLAHHAGDLTETILLNLSRGTGLAGLKGMPVQRDCFVRPLLFADREKIRQYAQEHNIEWREDSSNNSTKYRRNFVRHQIVPSLKEKLNPQLDDVVQVAAEQAAAAERVVLHQIKTTFGLVKESGEVIKIDLPLLQSLPEPTLSLYYLLKNYSFSWQQVKAITSLLNSEATKTGKLFLSSTHQALINRSNLLVEPLDNGYFSEGMKLLTTELTQAGPFIWNFKKYTCSDYAIKNDPKVAALDANLVPEPLTVRPWQEGDRFVPLGMKGSKKISDFMIDRKIPLNLKSRVWVACAGKHIIWVAGHRIDNRYKVTPNTKTVLELSITPL